MVAHIVVIVKHASCKESQAAQLAGGGREGWARVLTEKLGNRLLERLAHVAQAPYSIHGQRRRSLKQRPSPRLQVTWRVLAVTSGVGGGIRPQRRAVYLSGGAGMFIADC
jgi:hypothetical protein